MFITAAIWWWNMSPQPPVPIMAASVKFHHQMAAERQEKEAEIWNFLQGAGGGWKIGSRVVTVSETIFRLIMHWEKMCFLLVWPVATRGTTAIAGSAPPPPNPFPTTLIKTNLGGRGDRGGHTMTSQRLWSRQQTASYTLNETCWPSKHGGQPGSGWGWGIRNGWWRWLKAQLRVAPCIGDKVTG